MHLLVKQFAILSLELLHDVFVIEQFFDSAVRFAQEILN